MINYKFEHENVFDELVARGYFEQATYEGFTRKGKSSILHWI